MKPKATPATVPLAGLHLNDGSHDLPIDIDDMLVRMDEITLRTVIGQAGHVMVKGLKADFRKEHSEVCRLAQEIMTAGTHELDRRLTPSVAL